MQALSDVSLGFRSGEVLGLVGENGAGKSTLMRLLEGVYAPDCGDVRVDGSRRHFAEPRDAHAAGIRVIHQEPEIVPDLTVAENIFIGAMPRRLGRPPRQAQARSADPGHAWPISAWMRRLVPAISAPGSGRRSAR